jgi:Fe-S-cluster containining protein
MPKDSGLTGAGAALPKLGQPISEFVCEYTRSVMSQGATPQNLIRAVGKMDAIAEMEIARLRKDPQGKIACQAGCDHCCHRVVLVRVSEMIPIAQRVATVFTPAQRLALLDRCRQYANASERFRAGHLSFARPACPFLVDHRCSVYDVRPLSCRGYNSRSVSACEAKRAHPQSAPNIPLDERQNATAYALSDGHARALHEVGLANHFVDLGLALPALMTDPGLVQRYLEGSPILLEQAVIAPGPDATREAHKRELGNRIEPSGFPPNPAIPGHPVYEFLRLATPAVFHSQEEIDGALVRYERMIEEFVDTPMDPGAAFDGLSQFQSFAVAYTGEDVTGLMGKIGQSIVNPVVARALPDLVEPIEPRKAAGKLRVGYLSPHMFSHNHTNFLVGWIANHAEDIESYVFHTGLNLDGLTLVFRSEADHFYHLPGDVPSTARFVKSLDLDVLVFPHIGHTGSLYQFAGMRLAPVQCAAAGQPVTSGLSTIDYYISSELMEPPNGQAHYTEKLVLLPGSGLYCMRASPKPSGKSRSDLGIPEGLVYFVGQHPTKMTPKWDFLYLEIQARTGAPILFSDFGEDASRQAIQQRFEKAGIRATWIPMLSQPDYLRMQQLCDVNLDTPAWNGGNTTVQALSGGAHIVTLPGPFMRARHSLAYLKQANVEGFIARSPEDYVDLATDLDRLCDVAKGMEFDGILEDSRVPRALDAFLRRASGRE